jgi:diaminopimelate decarboxylase
MDIERAERVARHAATVPSLRMIGIHMHIGSQITTTEPYAGAVAKGVELIDRLRKMGHPIAWYNMGGGYGIDYKGGEARPVDEFASVIVPGVEAANCRLAIEPGRVIVGNAGILVSRVLYTKQSGEKRFLIQDAAMNDLIRPSLYDSYHRIWPVKSDQAPPDHVESAVPGTVAWDVVGPVCESGDFLAKDRLLPPMKRGELVATFSAGAYGMVMASNYNTRPRAAEILVDNSRAQLVRRRETYDDLVRQELEVR